MSIVYQQSVLKEGSIDSALFTFDGSAEGNIPELVKYITSNMDIKHPIRIILSASVNAEYVYKDLMGEYISNHGDSDEIIITPDIVAIETRGSLEEFYEISAAHSEDLKELNFENVHWTEKLGQVIARSDYWHVYKNNAGTEFINDCTNNGLILKKQ